MLQSQANAAATSERALGWRGWGQEMALGVISRLRFDQVTQRRET